MKKVLFETSLSRIYILIVCLVCMILLGSYFSYAMFTVSKEKSNAISIVTGNLTYDLKVDGVSTNELVIASGVTKTFTITLSNPNNRVARFNIYYEGALIDGLTAGYVGEEGVNIPPEATGVNLESEGVGSSQIYKIKVTNTSNSSQTIKLGVSVGLDYNNLTLPSNGHLFEEKNDLILAEVLLADNENNINTTDPDQTFITGTDPNNYIWYSGKLWRAVSIDPTDNSVKLITEWDISAFNYSDGNTTFEESYMKDWLNDTTADGFLGNLRDYTSFIKVDSKWNATMTTEVTKPEDTTTIAAPVGLLNIYEYTMSYSGTDYRNGYLNNGLGWWSLTPYNSSNVRVIWADGSVNYDVSTVSAGIRPAINLKSSVYVVDGTGVENDPYRLSGDSDTDLSGELLNTRYSGEYITFGTGENNLYRIVSHEIAGLTKITSAEPLKKSGSFINTTFGSNSSYSSSNTIGTFLNVDYLNSSNGYLRVEDIAMIEDNSTWYLGVVGENTSYKLAKYTNTTDNILTSSMTTAKVGLLRLGELMAGQFARYGVKGEESTTDLTSMYWTLTPYNNTNYVHRIRNSGNTIYTDTSQIAISIRPALNLKSNVVITGGDGTKENPFTIALK